MTDIPFNISQCDTANLTVEVITRYTPISLGEIYTIFIIFIFMCYWYIKVHKDVNYYQNWVNPRGRVVNLYKIIKYLFWTYVAMVMILGMIQTLMF